VLTVRDSGPGQGAEDITRLTDRFFRVTGNGADGRGLGLSIVVRIAEYFGGRVDFGAGIGGRGLAATVSFPVPPVAVEQSASTTAS
jgi:two-component system sensor histidine kinase QseC